MNLSFVCEIILYVTTCLLIVVGRLCIISNSLFFSFSRGDREIWSRETSQDPENIIQKSPNQDFWIVFSRFFQKGKNPEIRTLKHTHFWKFRKKIGNPYTPSHAPPKIQKSGRPYYTIASEEFQIFPRKFSKSVDTRNSDFWKIMGCVVEAWTRLCSS